MAKFFLAVIAVAFALLVGAFVYAAFTLSDAATAARQCMSGGGLFINPKILDALQSRQTEQAKHDNRDQHGSDSQR
jgi:hypothetical protein